MRYNIATVIDVAMLNKVVEENPSYIIMNSETLKAVQNTKGSNYRWLDTPTYHAYRGVPIAICEILKYGEVEAVNR